MRIAYLRLVPAAVLALFLGACARDPIVADRTAVRSGEWRVERTTDRVTGKPITNATLNTRTSSNASAVFPQPATLQLACFLGKPIVSFTFDFKIGTNLNSFLGYRFDDKPGHEIGARFLASANTVVIEDPAEVAQFASELATSNALYVRIRSLNAGRSSAEFKVNGAPAAIATGFDGCPVAQPAPPPQRATPPARRRSV